MLVGFLLIDCIELEYSIIFSIPFTVKVYITNANKHGLYYEEFKMVAIMFASLKNFELDMSNLRLLNEIVTEFDKVVRYMIKFE